MGIGLSMHTDEGVGPEFKATLQELMGSKGFAMLQDRDLAGGPFSALRAAADGVQGGHGGEGQDGL